jgi:hypothetical protein
VGAGSVTLVIVGALLIVAATTTLFNATAIAKWSNNLQSPWRSNVRNTRGMWIAISVLLIIIGAGAVIAGRVHHH